MTLSRREMYWLIKLVLLVSLAVVVGIRAYHLDSFYREQRAGQGELVRLADRRPANVSPSDWECATSWAVNAYGNVCIPEYVSLDEMRRLRAELEARLRGPVDLATVDWLWDRLGRTGPHGQDYRRRFEPHYRKGLGSGH